MVQEVSAAEFYGEGYDDSEERIPSIDLARELLDWEPRTGMREMLAPVLDAVISVNVSVSDNCGSATLVTPCVPPS